MVVKICLIPLFFNPLMSRQMNKVSHGTKLALSSKDLPLFMVYYLTLYNSHKLVMPKKFDFGGFSKYFAILTGSKALITSVNNNKVTQNLQSWTIPEKLRWADNSLYGECEIFKVKRGACRPDWRKFGYAATMTRNVIFYSDPCWQSQQTPFRISRPQSGSKINKPIDSGGWKGFYATWVRHHPIDLFVLSANIPNANDEILSGIMTVD